MSNLTKVADFAATLPSDRLPSEVRERTSLIIADCLGAIVGGAAEPEVQTLVSTAAAHAQGPAQIVGTARACQPGQAALINGTAGTWLEMDEGNQFCKGHPGMHTVPAALAHAQANGASGADFLAAVAIGYEVGARVGIGTSLRPSMHPHGTWGAICASVAVQRLAGANEARMRDAMNMAASMTLATSRRTMLEGGTVRNAFAGISGQMGLLCGDLVKSGFSGDSNGVGEVYGRVVSDSFDDSALTDRLGERWEVLRNYFKTHACCRFNHAALDALEQLTSAHPGDLSPDRIASITVHSYAFAAELDDQSPSNVLAAKFSVPFALATTLVNKSSKVESFTWEMVTNPAIQALAKKITVHEDPAMSAQLPDRRPARVEIVLTDDRMLCAATQTNRGDWADPYTVDEIHAKYRSLTSRCWTDAGAQAVWDAIMGMEHMPYISALTTLMYGAVRA